jgi:alkylhydroperoxidase/carboxymuconolactone decarboxylase family protein YurZ
MRKPSDPAANQGLFKLDSTFAHMAIKMGEATWGIQSLSQREKALLCLTADVCDHNVGLAFEMHIEMALANDVPLVDIREVIFHAAPEAGYTNSLQALIRFKQVVKEKQQTDPDLAEHGEWRDDRVSVAAIRNRLDDLASGFGDTWTAAVVQQWRRPNLSTRERCLLSIGADVMNHTLGNPFAHHVNLALSHGVTREHILDAVRFMTEFGANKAWEAMDRLKELWNAATKAA